MSQLFLEDGRMIPVTILEAQDSVVLEVKEADRYGYQAVQLGYRDKKHPNKSAQGHAKRANTAPKQFIVEFRDAAVPEGGLGATVGVDIFEVGDLVDAVGTTKGRGFAGAIKRHNFSRQPQSHGGMARRRPGAIGQCAYPGKVFKGKRMPGQFGNTRKTVQGLQVVKVDPDQHLVFIRGSVPGPNGGLVQLRHSVKGAKGTVGAS